MISPADAILDGRTFRPPPPTLAGAGLTDAGFLAAVIETQNDIAAVELDPETVMRIIVERAQFLTEADGALIDIVDGDEAVCVAAGGIATPCRGTRIPVEASTVGPALKTGEVQYCADTETDSRVNRDRCRLTGVRSLVAVPLFHLGHPVGVLKVVSAGPDAFRPVHFTALRLMAGLLGAALAHAAEFEARKRLLADRTDALAALREANECLRESEERFRGAFEHAPIGMALVSLDGRWKKVNASLCRIVGYGEDELLNTTFQAITHPDDLDADLAMVGQLVAGNVPGYHLTKRYFHRDGRLVWVLLSVSLVRGEDGRALYFVSQIQDITGARRKEMLETDQRAVLGTVAQDRPLLDALKQIAALVERQLEGAWSSIFLLDDGEIHPVAPSLPLAIFEAIRGQAYGIAAGLSQRLLADFRADGEGKSDSETNEEVGQVGRSRWPTLVSDMQSDPVWRGPAAGAAAAAAALGVRACWAAAIRSGDGTPLGILAVFCRHDRLPSDADGEMLDAAARLATVAVEHHQTTRQLAHLVRHDSLTGMPNRLCFEDRLQLATALARRSGKRVGVFVADVDHFKQVNDTLGHDAGDALLQQFAQRFRAQLRETDTLARMGGDEFMILLPELSCREGALAVAGKLMHCLREPFQLGGRELAVTSSMGIALFPDDGEDSATLQRRADEQMYLAKRGGRNGFSITPVAGG